MILFMTNCPYCGNETTYVTNEVNSGPQPIEKCTNCQQLFAIAVPDTIVYQCPVSKLEWEE